MDPLPEGGLGGASEGPLSRGSARTLYNLADALAEVEADRRVDVVPHVLARLRFEGVGPARRVWLLLFLLEWWPRLSFRSHQRFSWLPRGERRAALGSFSRVLPGPLARSLRGLGSWLEEARAGAQSSGA